MASNPKMEHQMEYTRFSLHFPKEISYGYTANICRDLQGLCRGFLQYLQGKSVNICSTFGLKEMQWENFIEKVGKKVSCWLSQFRLAKLSILCQYNS